MSIYRLKGVKTYRDVAEGLYQSHHFFVAVGGEDVRLVNRILFASTVEFDYRVSGDRAVFCPKENRFALGYDVIAIILKIAVSA